MNYANAAVHNHKNIKIEYGIENALKWKRNESTDAEVFIHAWKSVEKLFFGADFQQWWINWSIDSSYLVQEGSSCQGLGRLKYSYKVKVFDGWSTNQNAKLQLYSNFKLENKPLWLIRRIEQMAREMQRLWNNKETQSQNLMINYVRLRHDYQQLLQSFRECVHCSSEKFQAFRF